MQTYCFRFNFIFVTVINLSKMVSRKGSNEYFVETTGKILGTVRKVRRPSRLYSTPGSETRTDPAENSLHTKWIFRADHGTTDSVLREIYDAFEATRSTSSKCDET